MKSPAMQQPSRKPPVTARPQLLVNGSDREFRQFVNNLFSFLTLHVAIRDRYASCLGLTGPQYTILLCIQHLAADGAVTVSSVAEHLRLSRPYVTVETQKLEKIGLVAKAKDLSDGRAVSLTVTSRGDALLNSIAPIRRKVSNVQFAALSTQDFLRITPLIKNLIPCGERALTLLEFMQEHGEVATVVSPNGRKTIKGKRP